jgi:RNA polymerase subunit RPABC4/transcription elongation factor Spt4
MAENEQAKACSHCAEPIRAQAKVCPHCGRFQAKSAIYLDILLGESVRKFFGKRKVMCESTETKPCDDCAEPIRVAAKVCPYCRRLQSPWRLKKQLEAWLSLVFMVLMFFGGMIWLQHLLGPGRDFEKFKGQIVIINPEMHFSQMTNGNFISTIGQIRNESPYAWKDFQLEVQYFDNDGRMIDTRTENRYGDLLPAGETQAFKIRGPADKAETAYSTQKIFVRSAKDSRKWP